MLTAPGSQRYPHCSAVAAALADEGLDVAVLSIDPTSDRRGDRPGAPATYPQHDTKPVGAEQAPSRAELTLLRYQQRRREAHELGGGPRWARVALAALACGRQETMNKLSGRNALNPDPENAPQCANRHMSGAARFSWRIPAVGSWGASSVDDVLDSHEWDVLHVLHASLVPLAARAADRRRARERSATWVCDLDRHPWVTAPAQQQESARAATTDDDGVDVRRAGAVIVATQELATAAQDYYGLAQRPTVITGPTTHGTPPSTASRPVLSPPDAARLRALYRCLLQTGADVAEPTAPTTQDPVGEAVSEQRGTCVVGVGAMSLPGQADSVARILERQLPHVVCDPVRSQVTEREARRREEDARRTWTHALVDPGRSPFGRRGACTAGEITGLREAGVRIGLVLHRAPVGVDAGSGWDSVPEVHDPLDEEYSDCVDAGSVARWFIDARIGPVFVTSARLLAAVPEAHWLPVPGDSPWARSDGRPPADRDAGHEAVRALRDHLLQAPEAVAVQAARVAARSQAVTLDELTSIATDATETTEATEPQGA